MDMVDEFGHAEVLQSLSRDQLLLSVEVLQPLIVCVDVRFNTYLPVPPFWEAVHNSEQFLIMDWPLALGGGEGFYVVLNRMKVLASCYNMVL